MTQLIEQNCHMLYSARPKKIVQLFRFYAISIQI